jgi:hypothetical protein
MTEGFSFDDEPTVNSKDELIVRLLSIQVEPTRRLKRALAPHGSARTKQGKERSGSAGCVDSR